MPTSFAPPSLWACLVICQTNKQQAMALYTWKKNGVLLNSPKMFYVMVKMQQRIFMYLKINLDIK